MSEQVSSTPSPQEPSSNPINKFTPFDRMLFSIACAYLAVGLLVYWLGSQRKSPTTAADTTVKTSQKLITPEDIVFITHMRESLTMIDNSTPPPKTSAKKTSSVASVKLPGELLSQNTPPAVITPKPQPVANPLPPKPTIATKPANPKPKSSSTPVVKVGKKLSSIPVLPPPPPNLKEETPLISANIPSNPTLGYTLVGILEGDTHSSALFEVEGATQRVMIGEPIGTTGWTLLNINDSMATIKRQSQEKAIAVGQQF